MSFGSGFSRVRTEGDGIVSELRRAALLLTHTRPETRAEKQVFAAQYLACRLYASNHDLAIVGLYASAEAATPLGDPELPVVELGGFDLVLAAASPLGGADGAWFAEALEYLRARQIDVVLIDRAES
jgi:hypothetical protein